MPLGVQYTSKKISEDQELAMRTGVSATHTVACWRVVARKSTVAKSETNSVLNFEYFHYSYIFSILKAVFLLFLPHAFNLTVCLCKLMLIYECCIRIEFYKKWNNE